MNHVEHVFRPRTPVLLWVACLASAGLGVLVGYILGLHAGIATGWSGLIALVIRPVAVRLERDEHGAPQLATGRKERVAVDLSRLCECEFCGNGYLLRDQVGGVLLAPLDRRLRDEVRSAVDRRRLDLGPRTIAAFDNGLPGEARRWLPAVPLGVERLDVRALRRDRGRVRRRHRPAPRSPRRRGRIAGGEQLPRTNR